MPTSLTVREVAERYSVSEHTVLAWIDAGELAAVSVSRSATARRPTWRVTATALAAFEQSRAARPSAAPRARRARRRDPDIIAYY